MTTGAGVPEPLIPHRFPLVAGGEAILHLPRNIDQYDVKRMVDMLWSLVEVPDAE
jgi:hypothetical protein